MILGPVSYLDCIVFCLFLAPQLILDAGLFETTVVVLEALPFLRMCIFMLFITQLTPGCERLDTV